MFCKNCGNKLDDNDKVCAVCGEAVESNESPAEVTDDSAEKTLEKQETEPQLSVDEDIKTPLFNFKWNVHDFPKEETTKTEDIDFAWNDSEDSPVVKKMKHAVDPEEIAKVPSFSEETEKEELVTDEWYDPFSMKQTPEDETLFQFNKRNEEFQELLDKEYAKYDAARKESPIDTHTRRFNVDDFKAETHDDEENTALEETTLTEETTSSSDDRKSMSDTIIPEPEFKGMDEEEFNREMDPGDPSGTEELAENFNSQIKSPSQSIFEPANVTNPFDIDTRFDKKSEDENIVSDTTEVPNVNETIDKAEPADTPEPVEKSESIYKAEPVEKPESIYKSEPVEKPEPVKKAEPIGPALTIEPAELAKAVETVELDDSMGTDKEEETRYIKETPTITVTGDMWPPETKKDDIPTPAPTKEDEKIAGLGLFSTPFVSPIAGRKSDEQLDEKQKVEETRAHEEPSLKPEPTTKPEPAINAEPIEKPESTFKSEPTIKPEPTVKPEPTIESYIAPDTGEDNIAKPEPEAKVTMPGFIDTSVVSPFGTPDMKSASSTSIDDDEFLKDLPSAEESSDAKSENTSETDAKDVDDQDKNQDKSIGIKDVDNQDKDKDQNENIDINDVETKDKDLNKDEQDERDDKSDNEVKEQPKVVGPEIVNEPVVFPFEIKDEEQDHVEDDLPKLEKKVEQETPKTAPTPTIIETKKEADTVSKTEKDVSSKTKTPGTGLIKFLIAVIIIILLMLAGIGIMEFAPKSAPGIILNDLFGNNTKSTEKANAAAEPKVAIPNTDLGAVIESQLSENSNSNIKQIVYDESVGYNESVSYEISGANDSQPIDNNYWKKGDNGDLLYDEQAVKAIIGYNSTWVGYVNNGYNDVFNYVVPGSNAEKALKEEADEMKKGSSATYNRLGIGEVRQNGNKFYVWTKESITLKNKEGQKSKAKIKQVYELEGTSDSLKITNVTVL